MLFPPSLLCFSQFPYAVQPDRVWVEGVLCSKDCKLDKDVYVTHVSGSGTCLFGATWYGARLKMIVQYILVLLGKLLLARGHRFEFWGVVEKVRTVQTDRHTHTHTHTYTHTHASWTMIMSSFSDTARV